MRLAGARLLRLPLRATLTCAASALPAALTAQQLSDTSYQVTLSVPAFPAGDGPVVLVDSGHANFHTLEGRYAAFARLLRLDGFRLRSLPGPITATALASARLLVIANALPPQAPGAGPSAFAAAEIATLQHWVAGGGSLLLVADHMPFPGAVAPLAAAFGVTMLDGFATDSGGRPDQLVFRRTDGGLASHPITDGATPGQRIDSVRTFTGHAFWAPAAAPLLVLGPGAWVLLPSVPWHFPPGTPRVQAAGLLQGAAIRYGAGRVAVFGEAAMFTAQLAGQPPVAVGLNAPTAPQNQQFLLNVVHWLVGRLS